MLTYHELWQLHMQLAEIKDDLDHVQNVIDFARFTATSQLDQLLLDRTQSELDERKFKYEYALADYVVMTANTAILN